MEPGGKNGNSDQAENTERKQLAEVRKWKENALNDFVGNRTDLCTLYRNLGFSKIGSVHWDEVDEWSPTLLSKKLEEIKREPFDVESEASKVFAVVTEELVGVQILTAVREIEEFVRHFPVERHERACRPYCEILQHYFSRSVVSRSH
jgi:hypothetical protein